MSLWQAVQMIWAMIVSACAAMPDLYWWIFSIAIVVLGLAFWWERRAPRDVILADDQALPAVVVEAERVVLVAQGPEIWRLVDEIVAQAWEGPMIEEESEEKEA